MIDSVVLQLEQGEFSFVENGFFDATNIKQLNSTVSVKTLFSNFYKKIKTQKRYFPMITPKVQTIRRGRDFEKVYTIEMQVSLPKLLYGTNLWEITDVDLPTIYTRLQAVLKEAGVGVEIENVKNAVLKRVDFSKLLRLPSIYGSARAVIKQFSSMGKKQRTEWRFRDYIDESDGCSLKYHNTTQGYCIYDKFGEVIANGFTNIEEEWIEWMKEHKQKRNLIRFEFSLQRQQSLDAFLRRRIEGKKKDFTLADVMNIELAKKILLEVFDTTFDNQFACIVTLAEMRENEIERKLIEKKLTLDKHAKLSYLVNKAVKIGVQALLTELKGRYGESTCRRFKKDIIEITSEVGGIQGETPHLILYLREKHEQFELFTPRRS